MTQTEVVSRPIADMVVDMVEAANAEDERGRSEEEQLAQKRIETSKNFFRRLAGKMGISDEPEVGVAGTVGVDFSYGGRAFRLYATGGMTVGVYCAGACGGMVETAMVTPDERAIAQLGRFIRRDHPMLCDECCPIVPVTPPAPTIPSPDQVLGDALRQWLYDHGYSSQE